MCIRFRNNRILFKFLSFFSSALQTISEHGKVITTKEPKENGLLYFYMCTIRQETTQTPDLRLSLIGKTC